MLLWIDLLLCFGKDSRLGCTSLLIMLPLGHLPWRPNGLSTIHSTGHICREESCGFEGIFCLLKDLKRILGANLLVSSCSEAPWCSFVRKAAGRFLDPSVPILAPGGDSQDLVLRRGQSKLLEPLR